MIIELALPWPDAALSPNSHLHWRARQAAKVLARDTALVLAKKTGVRLDTVEDLELTLILHPPDKRHRDADNVLSAEKESIDSVCKAAGVDDSQIKRIVLEWGDVVKGGKIELRLEVLT